MADRADMISTSPDYPGVVAYMPGFRLAVSPRGASYEVQESDASGNWRVLSALPQAQFFWNWCFVNDFEPSEDFETAVEALPDDPSDCDKIPYSGGRKPRK